MAFGNFLLHVLTTGSTTQSEAVESMSSFRNRLSAAGAESSQTVSKAACERAKRHTSMSSRGTRASSNQICPLSTPFSPAFGPLSLMRMPRIIRPASSRSRTTKTCGPCFLPVLSVNCAKTVQICMAHTPCKFSFYAAVLLRRTDPVRAAASIVSGVILLKGKYIRQRSPSAK